MTPLTVAVYCGIAFVVFSILAVVGQVRKMQTFHKDAFSALDKGEFGGVFKGMLPIVLCGLFATFSGIGGVIALLFHFLGD